MYPATISKIGKVTQIKKKKYSKSEMKEQRSIRKYQQLLIKNIQIILRTKPYSMQNGLIKNYYFLNSG
ncbi:unnamed protein product [Paramecium octaurelia]|uniref:Uncharacterized protein n=1 Tax=Paramecium octaurelia TaxID=43137 RepID=A0A8S1THE7_PAROT|nr:unnamed protein product [Paramecium octaurelia]